jgi:signal peptidase I
MLKRLIFLPLLALIVIGGCRKSQSTTTTVPDVYKKIYGATDIYIDGDNVVIKSTGLPDHKSPYYEGTQWSNLYEAYDGTNPNWSQNPNVIAEFNYTFTIPLYPAEASVHSATPGGPIGVSLNGVPFFNQYAAMNSPLTTEINSFDQYNGHPQQQGAYHYHVEPTYLTATKGDTALLGFLLDGFPVYGPVENGQTITDADLDAYHGHFGVTADYPNGIYHYHITSEDPYINGDGFYGTAGTVSQ